MLEFTAVPVLDMCALSTGPARTAVTMTGAASAIDGHSCDDTQMTRQAQPDPMAIYGEQLHELLTEALALAESQLEAEAPDPDPWRQLAQRTYTFRSGLPANDAVLDELQAFAKELEHTLLARSRLESQPPQRVLFFGETLLQARRAFDSQMTQRLMPLAEALAQGNSASGS